MPTYDLTCKDCGENSERFVARLLRDSDKICPRCGSDNVRVGFGGGILGVKTAPVSSFGGGCGTGGFS